MTRGIGTRSRQESLLAFAALALILSACTTIPRGEAVIDPLSLLPEGKSMYASLGVSANREIAEALFASVLTDRKLLESFLARTDRVFIGADLGSEEPPSFLLAAVGSYPRGLIVLGLAGSGEWVREPGCGGPPVWIRRGEERRGGNESSAVPPAVSMSLPGNRIILVSTPDIPLPPIVSGSRPPSPFSSPERTMLQEADIAILSGRIPEFLGPLLGMDPSAIRMERFIAELNRASNSSYDAAITIRMESQREARALNAILRLTALAERKRTESTGRQGFLSEAQIICAESDVLVSGISLDLETLIGFIAGASKPTGGGDEP